MLDATKSVEKTSDHALQEFSQELAVVLRRLLGLTGPEIPPLPMVVENDQILPPQEAKKENER